MGTRWALAVLVSLSLFSTRSAAAKSVQPMKIMSAYVGADEILVELLPRELLAGVVFSPLARDPSVSAVHALIPPEAKAKTITIEEIVVEKPDIVFVAHFSRPEILELLKKGRVPYEELTTATTLPEFTANIERVGRRIQREAMAAQLVQKVTKDADALKTRCLLNGKTFLNFDEDYTVYGAGTSFDFITTTTGGRNLATQLGIQGWKKLGLENLVALAPDYVVVAGEPGSEAAKAVQLKKLPGWNALEAVKAGRLIAIPARYLLSVTHHLLSGVAILCDGVKKHGG